ncbi:MAG: FtsQ-type POTRA domain-containing protein, partial [Actinomycetota bacterium]
MAPSGNAPSPAAASSGAGPSGTAPSSPPPSGAAGPGGAAPAGGTPPPGGNPPAPQRRRADPWKAAFFVVAIAAIIAGVGWALLGSKFLVVRTIDVKGATAIPRGDVIAASGVKAGTPLIRVNTASVARKVEQLTLVESAKVRRAWPDGIVITLR